MPDFTPPQDDDETPEEPKPPENQDPPVEKKWPDEGVPTPGDSDNNIYTMKDGKVQLTGVVVSNGSVSIRDTAVIKEETYKVESIAPNALENVSLSSVLVSPSLCEDLNTALKNSKDTESVELTISGSGNDAVPADTFNANTKIKSVTFEGVTEVKDYAFINCTALTEVNWGSVNTIGKYSFAGCGFTSLKLSGLITNISDNAFIGCSELKELELWGVETIGDSAFYFCKKLERVYFPDTITQIGESAFTKCDNLTENGIYYGDEEQEWLALWQKSPQAFSMNVSTYLPDDSHYNQKNGLPQTDGNSLTSFLNRLS